MSAATRSGFESVVRAFALMSIYCSQSTMPQCLVWKRTTLTPFVSVFSRAPLLSEQAQSQRGQVMMLGAASTMLGATLAGFTGPWLVVNAGVAALAWTSAVAVALVVVVGFVREQRIEGSSPTPAYLK